MKTCSKCKEEKELSDFYIESRSGKPKSQCKVCNIKANSERKKNTRDLLVLTKTCNTCKEIKSSDLFSDNYLVSDGISNICKNCCVLKSKRYVENNELKVSEYQHKYKSENKDKVSEYNSKYKPIKAVKNKLYREKHLSEPINKIRKNTRDLVLGSFKRACDGIYKKSDKTENILGCSMQQFIEHLESLFVEGMALENHGITQHHRRTFKPIAKILQMAC